MKLKRWSILVSGSLSVVVFLLLFLPSFINNHLPALLPGFFNCESPSDGYYNSCSAFVQFWQDSVEYLFALLETFFFFFFFACIAYFLRKEVFKAWFVLGIFYVSVSLVWSFLTPMPSQGGFFIGNWISPGIVPILIAIPFTILSIFCITIAYFYYKKKDKN